MVIDNYIIFGGVNSADYGIAISGEGVFNAPERDADMIDIPGRNGSFALDKGKFRNITVTYRAFNYEGGLSTFRTRLSNFRNALCAQKGYQRLSDSFHPNEYRMATLISGIEFKPVMYNTASEFEIEFNCMPQRFLTSGETAQTISASGDTLTNPTLFDSHPLLQVTGYGGIGINDDELEIISQELGDVTLVSSYYNSKSGGTSVTFTITPSYASLHSGDEVTFPNGAEIRLSVSSKVVSIYNFSQTGTAFERTSYAFNIASLFIAEGFSFNYGTAVNETATFTVAYGDITMQAFSCTLDITAEGVITITVEETNGFSVPTTSIIIRGIHGDSTMTALGEPLYLDLDIGEAYKIEDGETVSVNSGVSLGYELPVLNPGSNTITFDNTVTDLKIVPRWWTV